MYYIGVDLGTSAVKLLLMEGNGKICNIVSNEYPLSFPQPGWSEQKPEDWWDAVVDGIKKLVDGFDASEVAGISFGGQMHGLVTVSYTHLDVYKRQVSALSSASIPSISNNSRSLAAIVST